MKRLLSFTYICIVVSTFCGASAIAELPSAESLDQILVNLGVIKSAEPSIQKINAESKNLKSGSDGYSIQVSSQNQTVNIQGSSDYPGNSPNDLPETEIDPKSHNTTFLKFGKGGFELNSKRSIKLQNVEDVDTIQLTHGPGKSKDLGSEGRRWKLAASDGYFPTLYSETYSSRILPAILEKLAQGTQHRTSDHNVVDNTVVKTSIENVLSNLIPTKVTTKLDLPFVIEKGFRPSLFVPLLETSDAERLAGRFGKRILEDKNILYGKIPGGWTLLFQEISSEQVVAYFSAQGKLLNSHEILLHELHAQEMYFVALNLDPGYRRVEMVSKRDSVNHQSAVYLPLLEGSATYHEFEVPGIFDLNFKLKGDVDETNGNCTLKIENTMGQSYSFQPKKAYFREIDFSVRVEGLLFSQFDPVYMTVKCNSPVAFRLRVMPGDLHNIEVVLPSRSSASSRVVSNLTPYFFPNLADSKQNILIKTKSESISNIGVTTMFNLEELVEKEEQKADGGSTPITNDSLVFFVSKDATAIPSANKKRDKNSSFRADDENRLFNFYAVSKTTENRAGLLELFDSNGKTKSSDWIYVEPSTLLYLF